MKAQARPTLLAISNVRSHFLMERGLVEADLTPSLEAQERTDSALTMGARGQERIA